MGPPGPCGPNGRDQTMEVGQLRARVRVAEQSDETLRARLNHLEQRIEILESLNRVKA